MLVFPKNAEKNASIIEKDLVRTILVNGEENEIALTGELNANHHHIPLQLN